MENTVQIFQMLASLEILLIYHLPVWQPTKFYLQLPHVVVGYIGFFYKVAKTHAKVVSVQPNNDFY